MATLLKPSPQAVKALLKSSESVTQANINRIWSDVLDSMLTLYLPPHRESSDAEMEAICARACQDYLEDLVEFSSDTLQAAWREIRRNHKRLGWPLIAEIRSACVAYQRIANRASESEKTGKLWPWEERARDLSQMTGKYVADFMRGELGQDAKAEGWDGQLRDYVWKEAHLQSQRIVRTGQGHVDVLIPDEMVKKWRAG